MSNTKECDPVEENCIGKDIFNLDKVTFKIITKGYEIKNRQIKK